jgi:DNA polymerase-1
MGIAWPRTHHDTLILAFLEDPDSDSLSLKPLAQRYLGEPPSEQDALRDFILDRAKQRDPAFAGATGKTFGAYIAQCPAGIVKPYACGDVTRTLGLFKRFESVTLKDKRLREAYERELKVTRSLIRMERRGIPVATRWLKRDIARYETEKRDIERVLFGLMKVKKGTEDFSWSGVNFAEQLVRSKLVTHLPLTEKGNPSTSAEALASVMKPELVKEFEVRAQIATCLNTFMRPWYAQGLENGGVMYARFNQVRNGDEWGKKTGARTGRLSMTPNLQNVIRSDKDVRVPILRDYIVPGPYAALGQRDYSQQELRLLGHFENGPLLAAYLADPERDGHELVRDLIRSNTGIDLPRRSVKDLNFGVIYGQGSALTAEKLGITRDEAKQLQRAHGASLPGLPALQKIIKQRCADKEPIWTWGGRRYFCEKPAFIRGRWMTFEYKMLNKLIQGSAADVTKQAMVNYDALGEFAETNPMILQVHDELIFGIADYRYAREVHHKMRDAMLAIPGIDIPMLSDGKLGRVSWHRMKKVTY